VSGTTQFLGVPPIISGTGKATDFKFGQYIQRVHLNKSPLKILEKRERGRIQGLSKFFGYPLLSQEREKLRISYLASTWRGSIWIKAHEKFWRKGSVGVSRGCPNFLGIPYYLRNGKSYGFQIWLVYSKHPSEQNPIKNFGEKGAWTYPGLSIFFRVPPIISGTAKAAIFKFCTHIYTLDRNKSALKISGKVL